MKKHRRKSKSAVVYIPIAILTVALLGVLGISAFLRIIEIEVVGARRYSKEEIIRASGISIGDNILFINTDNAINKIKATLPYVKEVIIEYDIPDTVHISISEAEAFATIMDSGGLLVIDAAGRVLDKTEVAPDNLIDIKGFTPNNSTIGNALRAFAGDETRLRYLKEVLEAIETEGIGSEISTIDVSSIANISFRYRGRFTVMLGTTDNIRYKFGTLAVIVEEIETNSPVNVTGTIYLSAGGPARWQEDR